MKSITSPSRGVEGGLTGTHYDNGDAKTKAHLLITQLKDRIERDPVGACEAWVRKGEKSCCGEGECESVFGVRERVRNKWQKKKR